MISLDMKMDVRKLNKDLAGLRLDLRNRATVMALNKTAAKAKTEMVRAITSEFALPASDVRSKLRILKASRNGLKATLDPFASGSRKGRSMNLIRFLEKKVSLAEGRRRSKAGTQNQLRFKVKKQGGFKTIKGAFIGNEGRTVFRRSGDGRFPIEAVSTIGVPSMFNTKRINARVIARIRKEFPIEFERASRQILRRFNK